MLPFFFASDKTADMPFLFIVLRALAETFNVIYSPVSGTKNFLV